MEDRIRVVLCEPGKVARTAYIGHTLEDMQRTVGGYLEHFGCFDDNSVCIVCDEEGKMKCALPNRAVYDESNRIIDIICGPFFICDCSGDDYASLPDDKLELYTEMFRYPEHFIKIDGELFAIPYDDEKDDIEDEPGI